MPLPNVGKNFSLYGPVALATAIANNGTLTIAYPAGTNQALFQAAGGGPDAIAIINNNDIYKVSASQIGVTYGSSNITLTNLTGKTWPANSLLEVQFDAADMNYFQGQKSGAITPLTSAAGTPGATVADVGASFSQATLNNNFASIVATQASILTALKAAGITA